MHVWVFFQVPQEKNKPNELIRVLFLCIIYIENVISVGDRISINQGEILHMILLGS